MSENKFFNEYGQRVNPLTGEPIETGTSSPANLGTVNVPVSSIPTSTQRPTSVSGGAIPSGWGVPTTRPVELPSGARVMIRHLDLPTILSLGVLDIMDRFSMNLLGDDQDKNEAKIQEAVEKDVRGFADIIEVVDKVVCAAVVEPKLYSSASLASDEEITPGRYYVEMIPLDDKMFIFEKSTPDLTDTFRPGEGSAEGMAVVEDVEGLRNITG